VIDVLVTAENRRRHRPVPGASSVESLDNESGREPQILKKIELVKPTNAFVKFQQTNGTCRSVRSRAEKVLD
jgi:hypothetical protein